MKTLVKVTKCFTKIFHNLFTMPFASSVMDLSPKYNDLWFGQGHGLVYLSLRTACKVALSNICIAIFFSFYEAYVPIPHLPSWSDITECSIDRKKESVLFRIGQVVGLTNALLKSNRMALICCLLSNSQAEIRGKVL